MDVFATGAGVNGMAALAKVIIIVRHQGFSVPSIR